MQLLRQGDCEGTVRSSGQQPPYCHVSDLSYSIATQRTVSVPEVESSRTHFEVLGLEALGPRKLPRPRLEDSTIF